MHFDEHGNLAPYEIIELSLPEFQFRFVDGLEDAPHRKNLFEQYLQFVEELKTAFEISFFQWIDGSFVTTKAMPGDLDVVTFLPYDTMNQKINAVFQFRENAKSMFSVDAKFCPVCKWNHRFYADYKEQENYWAMLYGFSRRDAEGKKWPKGIVKIDFQL